MRKQPKTIGKTSLSFRSLALAVGMGALVFSGQGHAETAAAFDDPFAEMQAIDEDELADSRGKATLPNGMIVEVSGLMRLSVDGQHVSTTTFGDHGPAGGLIPADVPFGDAPASVINSLNGISLDQYREINFHISNLPTNLKPAPCVPRADTYHAVTP